ncbi:MAG: hypothetical protein NTY01_02205 [Verrucomicrobia bacterium]|nr:hypothetical protein [Verrucomicrobiota bacterium]
MSRTLFTTATAVLCLAACTTVAQQSAPLSKTPSDSAPKIILKSVTFAGGTTIAKDDGSGLYDGPHWQDAPERRYPYLYGAGQKFAIAKASWLLPDSKLEGPFLVRGKASEGIAILGVMASSRAAKEGRVIEVTNPPTDAAPFPMAVRHFNTFDIQWQISWDGGGSWHNAGTSKNPIYVCLRVQGQREHPCWTVVHIGCGSP